MRVLRIVAFVPFLAALALVACNDTPTAPSSSRAGPIILDTFQPAVVVIGQPDMASDARNAGEGVDSVGLDGPFGGPAGASGGPVYIADQGNHRILGFNGIPDANGAAADFVMGQPDFTTHTSGVTASTFNVPNDCVVAGGRLFAVDLLNQRVLIWNTLPTGDAPADVVVGQADFVSHAPAVSRSGLKNPIGVAATSTRLFVLDFGNHRALIWNAIPTQNGAPADVVVGQFDFTSSKPGIGPGSFGGARAIWTDGERLVIGDSFNRRVLIWNSIPRANLAPADIVVGAANLSIPGFIGPSEYSVGNPQGVTSDGKSLFVADVEYNRILVFTPFPTTNGAAASVVLGQSDFTHRAENDDDQDGVPDGSPSARTIRGPAGLSVIGSRLFVCDQVNHRILMFTAGNQ